MCCVLIVKIVEAVVIHYTVYFDKFICRPYDVLKLRHMNWPAPESNKQGGGKKSFRGHTASGEPETPKAWSSRHQGLRRLSGCPSVTSHFSTKTTKRRITQTTPHDSPGTLVFWCQRSPRNSSGITPCVAPNARGVGQNRRLSTNRPNRLYLENSTR